MKSYDVIIIGGGPGGYVAAIRASQLGKKTAIIEANELGGICLNWGCIPTKSLLNNANVYETIQNAGKYGIHVGDIKVNWHKMIQRSRDVAKRLSKGIEYLLKKNKIDYISKETFYLCIYSHKNYAYAQKYNDGKRGAPKFNSLLCL